jgi:hypothetical protein
MIEILFRVKRIDSSDELPDSEIFNCEIETPQFHGSLDKFHLHRQSGKFNKTELKFYPLVGIFGMYRGGDHEVHFKNITDFKKCIVRFF